MDELTKVRVNNLISLRQSLLMLLPILIGGTIGMFFIDGYVVIRIILIILGLYFTFVLLCTLYNTSTEINQCIYKGEKNK